MCRFRRLRQPRVTPHGACSVPPWVASIRQGVLRDSLAVPFATPRRSRHTHEPRSFALTLRCCFGLSANEPTHEVRLGQTHPLQVGCVPPPIRWLFGTVLHHKTVLHIARSGFPGKTARWTRRASSHRVPPSSWLTPHWTTDSWFFLPPERAVYPPRPLPHHSPL